MAFNQEYSNFTSIVVTLFFLLCWLKPQGHYALNQNMNHQPPLYHTISVSSLISTNDKSSCNNIVPTSTSNGHSKRKASLRVAHKYGACSSSPQGGNKAETNANLAHEILSHDQARVESIKARLEKFNSNKDLSDTKTTTLPAHRGTDLRTLNYVVEVGLGTPAKQLSLVFDTGSDITWTQCQPCAKSCYQQQQPIFDPSKSTSFSNISCSSPLCSELESATGNSPRCANNSTCVYEINYGDNSFTVGIFGKEKLTLSGGELLENIPFGCGQNNVGLFGATAGLIGLGRDPLSIVSQTAQKYGKVFSYCLPTTKSTSGGYLSFGRSGLNANLQYTQLSTSDDPYYIIQMTAITVGGSPVPISATDLKSDGESIIDSGTVITRLPASIYKPMRDAFKKQMARYKMAQPISIYDTCYDFSNEKEINVPIISFTFGGSNVKVDIPSDGVFYQVNGGVSQVCLAFAEDSVNIFGNSQQQTLEVVYDVAGGKIGFAPNGCT
ncbi:aspartic protease [Lithospermum erythrorhizon]|uniref:Aspartic protease n=1 Tax=Lithospermum erythrorhizon TaxID=34254 RepID=A0AAV3RES8_LITER